MVLYRQGEKQLSDWLTRSRRKPLVLRGARQVGKSTLVETFARQAGLRLITVNCEKNRMLDSVFESLDLKRILPELVQYDMTASNIAQEVTRFLDDEESRKTIEADLDAMRARLEKPDALGNAAREILSLFES